MQLLGQILLGLIMIAIGILLLKFNYQVANNLRISFAEQHMGAGGSYLLWKIMAIVLVLAGLAVMFGIGDNILEFMLSPLTNVISPSE